jgi:hypothetical protein
MTHEQAVARHAVERYLLDEMPELERFAFEEHYFACPICAEDLRAGAVMQEGVKEGWLPGSRPSDSGLETPGSGLRTEAPGARPQGPGPKVQDSSARPHEWRGAIPWAVAAMLALAVGYQTLWVVPGLRARVMQPTVLSPVTLRGATRGAEPTLTRPTSGVLVLAVDLGNIAARARLAYDLRAADGTKAASGTAAAPPPGTPLLLLIPASALDSDGKYVLSIGTGDPGSAPVDYRFTLESEK